MIDEEENSLELSTLLMCDINCPMTEVQVWGQDVKL